VRETQALDFCRPDDAHIHSSIQQCFRPKVPIT
jgi:hypothetical protein